MIRLAKHGFAMLVALAAIGQLAMSEATARDRRLRQRQGDSAQNAPAQAKDSLATLNPKGPLQIVVSIGAQRLQLYDGDRLVATTTVSTGTGGHPTPTGVFAILDKEASHHSNIYGGASMPFMQRLTMSGVALHSGMVTGRPASHGCIRLPHSFAQQLFKITKLGTRVTIVPGEPAPTAVEHARLPAPPTIQPMAKSGDPAAMAVAPEQAAQPASELVALPAAGSAVTAAADAIATTPLVGVELKSRAPRKGQATLEREAALAAIPVSVFVSRQEGKVFVRRGFKPLFDAPVKISDETRPFGTHVFTAVEAKADGAAFKWIAVSSASHTGLGAEPRRRSRNSPPEPIAENHQGPPLGPAEALDRIELPKDAADRIAGLLALGATVIVSDLGPSREMRENGTDFVILTR